MLSCIWFMYELMACGSILVVSYMIRMSSTYRVYSSMFFVSRRCFMCTSLKCCRTISAIMLEMGDPKETPCSGW
jgi:hypothetical protein